MQTYEGKNERTFLDAKGKIEMMFVCVCVCLSSNNCSFLLINFRALCTTSNYFYSYYFYIVAIEVNGKKSISGNEHSVMGIKLVDIFLAVNNVIDFTPHRMFTHFRVCVCVRISIRVSSILLTLFVFAQTCKHK